MRNKHLYNFQIMTPRQFAEQYVNYFGEAAMLPVALCYTDAPKNEPRVIKGCMFKQFHRLFKGETITLDATSITCGGGKLYSGMGTMSERIYSFISEYERYKSDPETAKKSVAQINAQRASKPYLNFIRVDKLESFQDVEGLLFFATPDILSGLFTWANYDQTDINAVQMPWGSGCSATITALVNENRCGGKHCYLGMLDVSARPYFKPDILTFAIPMSRFSEMSKTFGQCCLAGAPAWLKVKKRINAI